MQLPAYSAAFCSTVVDFFSFKKNVCLTTRVAVTVITLQIRTKQFLYFDILF
jgi:hypothetical protein